MRAELVLGNLRDTVCDFVRTQQKGSIGFISIDLDLYTSTCDALQILSLPEKKILKRVSIYLDDTEAILYHLFAGEYLAVEHFNEENDGVKIDRWRGLQHHRPFPENRWINRMWIAYDLDAISELGFEGREVQVL